MMKWRKWNNILHRDIGYLCFGLTLIYAVSGVAVNHVQDWNPNYSIEIINTNIGPVSYNGSISEERVTDILKRLGEAGKYKSIYFPDPKTVQIFLEGSTITVDLGSGAVRMEKVKSRFLLREMNVLHLNHPKKLWTYFADLYAVCLVVMAVTGLFVLKGKYCITARCIFLTSLGIMAPIIFLWFYL